MATPPSITLKNLDGQWVLNRNLSSDYDPVLKLQGINWLMRKVMDMASVIVSIKKWEDSASGLTHMTIENKPSTNMPSITEVRVLNFQKVELTHPLFGRVRGRSRWTGTKDLEDIDVFLTRGFGEEMNGKFVHIMTEHLDYNAVTQQAWGFEEIEGTRFHTRNIVVSRGDEVLRVKLVYDYVGPRPAVASSKTL